jgi:peptidoglycan hydrolase CwlO-like protein
MNTEILLIISNGLTGIAAWMVGRRRQQADTDNQVLKNLELSINIYAELVSNLKEEIKSLNIKIQELEKKVDELHQENKRLKSTL